jgi:hypothetical protein
MRRVLMSLSGFLIAGCAAGPGGKGFASFPGEPARVEATAQAAPSEVARLDPVDLPAPIKPAVEKQAIKSNSPGGARVQFASAQSPVQASAPVRASSMSQVVAAADPAPLFRPVVNLAILRFSLPQGALSANESFWKRIDEQSVDAATYDVLFKNGLRVGRAPMVDLDYLIRNLEQQGSPKPHQMTYVASGTKVVEYPMKDVAAQIIYWFDRRNEMSMRSYDASANLFCVEFEPAPRKAGDVRVSLCPMVRGVRKHLAVVNDGDEPEVQYVAPERRYELNLRADVPLDSVLIVAPSPEARAKMSVGHSFMVHDGATGLLEDVLLLVPQAGPGALRSNGAAPTQEEGGTVPELR